MTKQNTSDFVLLKANGQPGSRDTRLQTDFLLEICVCICEAILSDCWRVTDDYIEVWVNRKEIREVDDHQMSTSCEFNASADVALEWLKSK